MNKDEALRLLSEYLSLRQNDFVIHPEFIREIKGLLKKEIKGSEAKFFQQMIIKFDNKTYIIPIRRKMDRI